MRNQLRAYRVSRLIGLVVLSIVLCGEVRAADSPAKSTSLEVVLQYAKSPSFKVRAQAAMVLGTLSDESGKVLKALTRLLYDKHRVVRAAAVLAVGKFGDIRSISALSDVLHDEDIHVTSLAERTVGKLVRLFKIKRVDFSKRRWVFRIQHFSRDILFKEYVMSSLLEHDNIEVGVTVPFDETEDADSWPIELELRGKLLALSTKRLKLQMVLAFRHGGHVIKKWQSIRVGGKSREEVLKNGAGAAVTKVLAYLGAN